MHRFDPRLAFGLLAALAAAPSRAADTQVAVAANFTAPAREIAAAFARATGHHAILSFGASGAFYTQIAHGAPFDLLLSADADRPKRLAEEGLGVPGSRFTYAIGRLVLYSSRPGLVGEGGQVLATGEFGKLAIADPAAAPYGLAAVQTMQRMRVLDRVTPRLVKGTSITQAYKFVATGAADLGFVAQSQVIATPGGSRWLVPARYHAPIEQQAILTRQGASNPAAVAFLKFLKRPEAISIIRTYGYEVK